MNPEKIGHFIYELRKENNLSQYQLADMIPISRQAVSKWERGKTIPDSSTLICLSEIFHVSINELLEGERINKNTIKSLEITTLNLLDDRNQKKKQLKNSIIIFSSIVIILIIIFLLYYFIQSYNSIRVYTIHGKGKEFDLYDGIYITTNTKKYLKVGKLSSIHGKIPNQIRLYYKNNKDEKTIMISKDVDRIIIDKNGYEEYLLKEDNVYIEILYEEEKDCFPLVFTRDFVNNETIFKKTKKGSIPNNNKIETKDFDNRIIDILKQNESYNNTYSITIDSIQITYYEELEEIELKKENQVEWLYFINTNQMHCFYLENDMCKKKIKEDINQYILGGT